MATQASKISIGRVPSAQLYTRARRQSPETFEGPGGDPEFGYFPETFFSPLSSRKIDYTYYFYRDLGHLGGISL